MNERHLMHVIALCGLSTAGKTTAADYIQEEFGAARLRFAKPLRDMLEPLGLTQAELWGDKKQVPCDALNGCTPSTCYGNSGRGFGAHWARTSWPCKSNGS